MAAVSPEPSAVAQSTLTSRGPAGTLTVNLITPSLSKAETSDIDISGRSLSITRMVADVGTSKSDLPPISYAVALSVRLSAGRTVSVTAPSAS